MKKKRIASFTRVCLTAGAWFAQTTIALAVVTTAPLFPDGAVLQRDKPLPVWGSADPAEKVRVRFREQAVETTAHNEGRWRCPRPTWQS